MDRNGLSWPWKDTSLGDSALDAPARSSSAPPDQPGDVLTADTATNMTITEKAILSLPDLAHKRDRVDARASHRSNEVPSLAAGHGATTVKDTVAGYQCRGGRAVGATLDAWPTANRTQSLPSLAVPDTSSLSGALEPFPDIRHGQGGSLQSLQGYTPPGLALTPKLSQLAPARAAEALYTNTRYHTLGQHHTEVKDSCQTVWSEEQIHRHDAIASRVGAMELSAAHTTIAFPLSPGQVLAGDTTSFKPTTNHGWADMAGMGDHSFAEVWRQPSLDSALRHGLGGGMLSYVDSGQERSNPMWGLGEEGFGGTVGGDWKSLHASGADSYYQSSSTGGTSSLASSRSMPEMTTSSGDPWITGVDTDWMNDEHYGGVQFRREDSRGSQVGGRGLQGSSDSSNGAPTTPSGTTAFSFTGSRDAGSATGTAHRSMGNGTMVNRVEEGLIGSKRRIWFRAPNGQFASATQTPSSLLHGGTTGNDHGEGGSRGNDSIRRIRRRRKSEEVDRKYRCDYVGCDKAYGTLNHLNTHRATNEHGPRLNAVGYRRANAERLQRLGESQGA